MHKAKQALSRAKQAVYEAMSTYKQAMGGRCVHGGDMSTLWEDGMSEPKMYYECCGSDGGDCDGVVDPDQVEPDNCDSDETQSF